MSMRARRAEIGRLLEGYGAANPRLIGSVARGEDTSDSDLDLLVDLEDREGPFEDPLLRVAGLGEELSELLGTRVDVVCDDLLRDAVAESARRDAEGL